MKRALASAILAVLVLVLGCGSLPIATQPEVSIVPVDAEQRVDVLVDGSLFTSYVYADSIAVLKKPVLYPIRSADGVSITRHYPLEPWPGERTDHPHQIGMWFNYGDVDGLDFWNNSDAVSAERAAHMGTIRHRSVDVAEGGAGQGVLEVASDWLSPDGDRLLAEETRYVFHAGEGFRAIDRITTLTAVNGDVAMPDNKEGVLGLRVRRELEMPAGRPIGLTDAQGRPLPEDVENDEGVTGQYRNSEGVSGYPDVWGKRARWTALSGVVDGDSVTVAVFDHPENVGYPTHWHVRDYGLFAANPLGQEQLSEGAETLDYSLADGESVTFRHRVAVFSGAADDEEIDEAYAKFEANR